MLRTVLVDEKNLQDAHFAQGSGFRFRVFSV